MQFTNATTACWVSNVRIWSSWNQLSPYGYSVTSGTSNALIWSHWINSSTTSTSSAIWPGWVHAQSRVEITAEQRAAREQADREYAAQRERERAATAEAKAKAEKLLQSALTDAEKTELRDRGFFTCRSRKGNLYRVYRGSHGNVKRLDPTGKKEIEKLCVQPPAVPEGDCMLAQKLHIEHDEDGFRKTANITPLAWN